jgi:hypothetical protein
MSQHDATKALQLNVSLKGDREEFEEDLALADENTIPSLWGLPLKYVS